ncbi:MAG: GNAT family N-acetyltransferase [Candidatus Omnitrophota bacterium]
MANIVITRAAKEDAPYIEEKLKNYLLDAADARWQDFFVLKADGKTVSFARILDRGDYVEIASLGVDYYHRDKGYGVMMLKFIAEEAKKQFPSKKIYGVTHRPGFLKKIGFVESEEEPEELKIKQDNSKDPSKVKIMRLP